MRVLFVLVGLLISGCATDFDRTLAGSHTKSGGPIRFERLGALTSEDISSRTRCGAKQVSWCVTSDPRENCQCIFVRQAEDKVRQVLGQRSGPQN